ncbi:ABC transporter ATPase [Corynebacterium suranareeae]|uniref:ABC transporter ATPase n=1 Tax=Corynebacterium suranareeae TaxID=2506452 RepID=A0A160PNA8_9CORY|nr:ABC transporter ATP-binding protein [Corynebacterium suranareeae]BAU94293.1 ABC transporter ATPase [Corynebacterium suranareeae]
MLQAHDLTLGYGGRHIVEGLSLDIPEGGLSIIIGPNGCGKSTVLKALGRLLKPQSGQVTLHGRDISSMGTKQVAKHIGLLPQSPHAPDGVSVTELVSRGRYPHQHLLSQWSKDDEKIVERCLAEVAMHAHADHLVSELSGGQRQRAWIAMALAQETSILLLDEPTTFLDIAHQIAVLDLCSELHQRGQTLAIVLHDLNMAARYATHIIAMRDGTIIDQGKPDDILTEALLKEVFDLDALVLKDPNNGRPLIVPKDRRNQ